MKYAIGNSGKCIYEYAPSSFTLATMKSQQACLHARSLFTSATRKAMGNKKPIIGVIGRVCLLSALSESQSACSSFIASSGDALFLLID